MNYKEITDGNELINEFMGLKDNIPHDHQGVYLYYTSWEWIMPVLTKISNHKSVDTISICLNCGCDICFKGLEVTQIPNCWTECSKEKSLIECCFESVVKFIKWYNQQNKQL